MKTPMKSYDELREAYIQGDLSVRQLSDAAGLSYNAARKRCAAEGWVKRRAEYREKADELIRKTAAETAAAESAKKLETLIRASDFTAEALLSAMMNGDYIDEKDGKANFYKLKAAAESLELMTKVIRNLNELYTDAELEERELKRRKLEHEIAEKKTERDNEIVVVFKEE